MAPGAHDAPLTVLACGSSPSYSFGSESVMRNRRRTVEPLQLHSLGLRRRVVSPHQAWKNQGCCRTHEKRGPPDSGLGASCDEAPYWGEAWETVGRCFHSSLDLLCLMNPNGCFRRLNRAWETVLGYSLDELAGAPFCEFVHPEDRDATVRMLARLGAHEPSLAWVNRCRTKDGSYRSIDWRSFSSGALIFAAGRDISEA